MAINLNKVTIENSGESHKIDLTKGGSLSTKEIVINLTWSQPEKKKGIFSGLLSGKKSDIDLDLGCFYQLQDGQKSVIDGLQFSHGRGGPKTQLTKQGRYTGKPWIWHTGDERSGTGAGENMFVNPVGLNEIKRIVVYCFIYEGAARWQETNAVVTVSVPNNPDVVVEMGKQYSSQTFCAIAELLFDSNNSITVKKLVSFHNGHGECDKTYGWGMSWTSGSK